MMQSTVEALCRMFPLKLYWFVMFQYFCGPLWFWVTSLCQPTLLWLLSFLCFTFYCTDKRGQLSTLLHVLSTFFLFSCWCVNEYTTAWLIRINRFGPNMLQSHTPHIARLLFLFHPLCLLLHRNSFVCVCFIICVCFVESLTFSIISTLTRPSWFLTIQTVTEEPGSCLTAGIIKGTHTVCGVGFHVICQKRNKIRKRLLLLCQLWIKAAH